APCRRRASPSISRCSTSRRRAPGRAAGAIPGRPARIARLPRRATARAPGPRRAARVRGPERPLRRPRPRTPSR
ncbi:MAG: hypothetical protein E6K51_10420, partial [Gammaproteobacteria bacterium]